MPVRLVKTSIAARKGKDEKRISLEDRLFMVGL
jgi:hypothetical protein